MTKFTGKRYEVGMLWNEAEPNLPNNYSSAWGQFYSLEQRLQRNPNLKSLYQQSIDGEKGFVKILNESEVKGTYGEKVFATTSSAKREQAWQSKTCLQSGIEVQRSMPKQQATSRT